MAKIDSRLRFVMRSGRRLSAGSAARFGAKRAKAAKPAAVDVLVRLSPGARTRELEAAGLRMLKATRSANTIAVGRVTMDKLSVLRRLSRVRRVEAARPLLPELDVSVRVTRADVLHTALGLRGKGVLVGIIDGGIDWRHPDLRRADGRTRIRYLWDQTAPTVRGGRVPFGREYTAREIDAALRGAAAPRDVPKGGRNDSERLHGTHVAAVAAGSGHGRGGFPGHAPEADLIVVALRVEATIGRSDNALEAFDYMVRRARGTPIAINLSRGMNGGGHCGETVLEAALDDLARLPDVAIVKSAGNEHPQRLHAGGMLRRGKTRRLGIEVPKGDVNDDLIEIWFDDGDVVSVSVQPPSGPATPLVSCEADDEHRFETAHGDRIVITIDTDAADTADTMVTVVLSPARKRGRRKRIEPGLWTLQLKADAIAVGRFDAWIERVPQVPKRKTEQARFTPRSSDASSTVTIPGTARHVITVGSYVTKQAPDGPREGALSPTSSHGPTRYGYRKPDLVAPGEWIEAAKAGTKGVMLQAGTSLAAPAVAGVAALIMSQRRGLCSYQLGQILARSARRDGAASAAPDDAWGYGRLDAPRALALALRTRFPVISNVRVQGTVLTWRTDIPSRSLVRCSRDRTHLQLGKDVRVLHSRGNARRHRADLAVCGGGTYYCEIVAFGPRGFYTEDDNGGNYYLVQVPLQRER